MALGADSWSRVSAFQVFDGRRLVSLIWTLSVFFEAPMVLFELWGVGVVVGGREDPVPPSPLRLVEFFQPAHFC